MVVWEICRLSDTPLWQPLAQFVKDGQPLTTNDVSALGVGRQKLLSKV